MSTRTEIWNGHQIRFVEVKPGDWWAVAKDVSDALDYSDASAMTRHLKKQYFMTVNLTVQVQERKSIVLSEFGIYKAIFNSHKPEAEAFQEWVFSILKKLRQASGLAGFDVFRMMDKEEQRKQMARLSEGLRKPVRISFIKANTIANKAVSSRHGYPKKISKTDMTPEMIADREPILADVVDLMTVNDRFGLNLSVSKAIYKKYAGDGA